MSPRVGGQATVAQRADACAGVWPRIARRRRFQRILRAFARVLAFTELESRVGLQVEGSRPQERCLTLFMLALWHAEEPFDPKEVVKVRQDARARMRLSELASQPDGLLTRSAPHLFCSGVTRMTRVLSMRMLG